MYNPMAEPGFGEEKGGMPQPGQQQEPPAYSQPGMGYVPPTQQQMPSPMHQQPPPMHQQPPPMQQQHPPMQQQPMPQPGFHSTNTNTTVVVQQQPAQIIVQGPRQWTTGICSCFDDCGVCILGWCCPCILQCSVSSGAGECCCVAALCPIALRTKIRTRHNIAGSIVDDCCTLAFCGPCAMCQMAREVNINGM